MTRKRFCKLIIAQGIQRNTATDMAKEVEKAGSYERLYFWFVIRKRKWQCHFTWADLPETYAAADLAAGWVEKHRCNDSLDAMLYAAEGFRQITGTRMKLTLEAWEGLQAGLRSVCEVLKEEVRQAAQIIQQRLAFLRGKDLGEIFKGGA